MIEIDPKRSPGSTDLMKVYAEVVARMAETLYFEDAEKDHFFAFRDACSRGQSLSKIALAEILSNRNLHFKKGLFLGHWHGLLPLLLNKMGLVDQGVGIELSKYWSRFSGNINRDWKWHSFEKDATLLEDGFFQTENFDLVVNTSSEHMNFNWLTYIPKGTTVLAQANNYDIPEHSHRQGSVEEFIENLNLSQTEYFGEQEFGIYKRFTVLGKK